MPADGPRILTCVRETAAGKGIGNVLGLLQLRGRLSAGISGRTEFRQPHRASASLAPMIQAGARDEASRHRFVMPASFTNQTPAQIELVRQQQGRQIRQGGLRAAEDAGREGRAAALARIGVKLTELRKDQAEYISVNEHGPFKPDHYRY
jgi:hypothetical protein